MAARIALATCAELPGGDPDDAPLPALLGDAAWVVWDDPTVDWDAFDLVVVRSTWDYQHRRHAFLAWADRLGPDRLVNPPATLRWNTDKRYLVELAAAGLPVVPTALLDGGATPLPTRGEYVVKPTVSAGSKDTARFGEGPEEAARARALQRAIEAGGRTAMLQRYLGSVDTRGETALLFFDGAFSHAIRKGPLLQPGVDPTDELFAPEEISARDPTHGELDLAARVLDHVGRDLLYARIDVVEDDAGRPVLLELELTEPSLFLAHAEGAAERFAAAVLARGRG